MRYVLLLLNISYLPLIGTCMDIVNVFFENNNIANNDSMFLNVPSVYKYIFIAWEICMLIIQ